MAQRITTALMLTTKNRAERATRCNFDVDVIANAAEAIQRNCPDSYR